MTDAPPRADEDMGLVHLGTKQYCLVITGLFIGMLACAGHGMAAMAPGPCPPVITVDPGGSVSGAIGSVCDGGTIILNPGTHYAHGIWTAGKSYMIRANTSYGGNRENTVIDAQDLDRFLEIHGGSLTLDNLSLVHGKVPIHGGLVYSGGGGVTLSTVALSDSSADLSGGAVYSAGPLTVSDSLFANCSAQSGGALYSEAGTVMTVTASRFTNCTAMSGGAIFTNMIGSTATVTVSGSSFSGCSAANAGGAIFGDDVIVTTSDFSGCGAYYGGGIYSWNQYTVTSSSFEDCRAGNAGGAVFGSSAAPNFIRFCRIYQCGGSPIFDLSRGSAQYNWFGTNSGPGYSVFGAAYAPWLVLGTAASPATITRSQTSAVSANLTYDSAGIYHDPAGGHVPDGIPAAFSVTQGSGTVLPVAGLMVSGGNGTRFTPEYAGISWVNATVDGESAGVPIQVNGAGFTGTPLAGTAPLRVVFTDASAGLPDAWNWSFGDGVWFNTTDPAEAGANHTYTLPGTYTVSLTVDLAGTPDTLTRTGYVTVSPVAVPVPLPTYSQQDTGETLDDFPQSPATPVMTVTVNIGGDSKAWQAVVTGTGLRDLIVTGTEQHGPFGICNPPAGSVFQYLGLEPARYGTITDAVISFTVPQAWLDENHIDPKSIVLYHMTTDCWQPLPTTFLYEKDGTAYFSGRSSGFSSFAIAGMPAVPATPAVAVTTPQETPAEVVQTPSPVITEKAPVATQTTAPPAAPAQAPAQSAPFPLVPVLAVICCAVLVAGGWYARRWWIRRQNPALFEEY